MEDGQTYNSLGYPAGGSFLEVASEQMHLTLLPAARRVYAYENAQLTAASARATGLPLAVVTLAAGLAVGFFLYRSQRWLSRRTHRTFNVGLLLASVAGVAALAWMAVALLGGRADLLRATGHGSAPAETLAQADIAALQARGDETLNLISRTGDTDFQADFQTAQGQLSTLLTSAGRQSAAGAASSVAAARQDANSWFAVNRQAQKLDQARDYGAETRLVIGSGPGSAGTLFGRLEADLGAAIRADQAVFAGSATAGSGAFTGLAAGSRRARAGHGGGLRLGAVPAAGGVPMNVPAMSREQAGAAVKAAVAERDAIQANLLELDSSFGKQLLAGAELTGETRRRWDATAATLAILWQVYEAYSAVVDQAAEAVARHLGPRELAALTALLTGRSVQLASGPAPLAGRDLADPGREDLTLATAVARMRGAFSSVTEVVSAAEHVWTEVAGRLDTAGAELARVTPLAAALGDEALTGNLAAAQGKLARMRDTLNSDPLALWQGGTVDTSGADRLQERIAAAVARADELIRTLSQARPPWKKNCSRSRASSTSTGVTR